MNKETKECHRCHKLHSNKIPQTGRFYLHCSDCKEQIRLDKNKRRSEYRTRLREKEKSEDISRTCRRCGELHSDKNQKTGWFYYYCGKCREQTQEARNKYRLEHKVIKYQEQLGPTRICHKCNQSHSDKNPETDRFYQICLKCREDNPSKIKKSQTKHKVEHEINKPPIPRGDVRKCSHCGNPHSDRNEEGKLQWNCAKCREEHPYKKESKEFGVCYPDSIVKKIKDITPEVPVHPRDELLRLAIEYHNKLWAPHGIQISAESDLKVLNKACRDYLKRELDKLVYEVDMIYGGTVGGEHAQTLKKKIDRAIDDAYGWLNG